MKEMKLTVKRDGFNNFILMVLIIVSFISYERYIYSNYYKLLIMLTFILGVIIFISNIIKKRILSEYILVLKDNWMVHILAISLLVSTLMASMKGNLASITVLLNIIVTILSLYIFFLYIPRILINDIDKKVNQLIFLITIFSIIAIIIRVKGSFLGYLPTHYPRVASVFFDPNYFGTLAGVGVILSINKKGKYKLIALLNLLGLYFSGSRAAMISLVFIIIVFYFYKKKISIKTVIAFICLGIITYYAIEILINKGFFRIYQGLSSRDYLWKLSFELIKKEPLWGYGYGSVGNILRAHGASNGGSHNAYIDYIMTYGIISFFLYGVIIVKALLNAVQNNVPSDIIKVVLFLLIGANSISINVGGLGATSLILTLFLGVCNLSKKMGHNKVLEKGKIIC